MAKEAPRKQKQKAEESALAPLPPHEALRGALQTGRSPEPENKHAKRTATKQRLIKDADDP
jgi:hypothetical protein